MTRRWPSRPAAKEQHKHWAKRSKGNASAPGFLDKCGVVKLIVEFVGPNYLYAPCKLWRYSEDSKVTSLALVVASRKNYELAQNCKRKPPIAGIARAVRKGSWRIHADVKRLVCWNVQAHKQWQSIIGHYKTH